MKKVETFEQYIGAIILAKRIMKVLRDEGTQRLISDSLLDMVNELNDATDERILEGEINNLTKESGEV